MRDVLCLQRVRHVVAFRGILPVIEDPTDVGAVARGLTDALRRGPELRQAGIRRAGARTWRDVARETLEVYREAGG